MVDSADSLSILILSLGGITMRAIFCLLALFASFALSQHSDAAQRLRAKNVASSCSQTGPNNTCLRCDFNIAGIYIITPTPQSIAFYCPKMPANATTVATIQGTSTAADAPSDAGTWQIWRFDFLKYSNPHFQVAGPHSNGLYAQLPSPLPPSPPQTVPTNRLVSVIVTPVFNQWGNGQGINSPAALVAPSTLTIQAFP